MTTGPADGGALDGQSSDGQSLDGHFLDGQSLDGHFLDGIFVEASRQLTICNACRYCEGYCAVFPALERLSSLTPGDVTHFADLCHD